MSTAEHIRNGAIARDSRGRLRVRHTCSSCGTAFYPSRADAKYCSGGCKQAAYRRRQAEARYG